MIDSEDLRQVYHLLFGLLCAAIILLFGKTFGLIIIGLLFLGALLKTFLLKKGITLNFLKDTVNMVSREKEKFPTQGMLFLFLGVFLSLLIFPPEIAFSSALVLAVGDSFSTLFGKRFGKTMVRGMSLEGTFFGIAGASIALSFFNPIYAALLGSIVGLAAEYLPFEDNIMIPLVSGLVLFLL